MEEKKCSSSKISEEIHSKCNFCAYVKGKQREKLEFEYNKNRANVVQKSREKIEKELQQKENEALDKN